HFYFGFLAGISDLDLQPSSLSKLNAAHGARPFTHLPGDASAPSARKVQVLHQLSPEAAGTPRPPFQIRLFRLVWLVRFVWLVRLLPLFWVFLLLSVPFFFLSSF